MTTYPLSEPATVRRTTEVPSDTDSNVVMRGSLADCADFLGSWSADERATVEVELDDMDLRYDPGAIDELLTFLREESAGLSNKDIAEIAESDR